MMLTWKIFVTIVSMVSLTLQMDPFGEGSSLDAEYYSSEETSSDEGSTLSRFSVYDPVTGQLHESSYNLSNPYRIGSVAAKCFGRIRLYCKTYNDEVSSDNCAKKGILLYKKRDDEFVEWADPFFQGFPLVPGNFELPAVFCRERVPKCKKDLRHYSALVKPPYNESQEDDEFDDSQDDSAEETSRIQIANFAFIHRKLLGLQKGNFERKYLRHISKHVSSGDETYNPKSYCLQYDNRSDANRLTVTLVI